MSLKRSASPSSSKDDSGSMWLSQQGQFHPIKLGWSEHQFPAFAQGVQQSFKARVKKIEDQIVWEYLNRFLDFGVFKDYMLPKVEVEGLEDPIAFPLCGLQADVLKSLCQPAKYTNNGEPTYDPEVRNSWEIKSDKIKLDASFYKNALSQASSCISAMMGFPVSNEELLLKFDKMMLYEKGGFFKMHQDRKREPAHFATFIVVLPAVHTRGSLHFSFGQSRTSFVSSKNCEKLQYACFFLDILHELQEVTSGRRLVLIFQLCYKDESNLSNFLKPGPQNQYGHPIMPLRGD